MAKIICWPDFETRDTVKSPSLPWYMKVHSNYSCRGFFSPDLKQWLLKGKEQN